MRLAVFIESHSRAGGAFEQSLSVVKALSDGLSGHQIVVLTPCSDVIDPVTRLGVEVHLCKDSMISRFLDVLPAYWPQVDRLFGGLRRLGMRAIGGQLDRFLAAHDVDIAYFNTITDMPLRLSQHPFVTSVWDLAHRIHPEFPELSADREFERREQRLRGHLTKALAVITTAPSVGRKICALYDVDPQRVHAIPQLPSLAARRSAQGEPMPSVREVRERFGLERDFIFYPAQFWPHKNHAYILEAVALLRQRHGLAVDIVFTGGDRGGGMAHVKALAGTLDLADRLHLLGFVAEDDLPALYRGARALVMPSYVEPTNLPPLEAAILGCPILYTDTPGSREWMGEAALFCDLGRPESLAEHLRTVLTDPAVVAALTAAARTFVARSDPGHYALVLQQVLDDYAYKRRLWA